MSSLYNKVMNFQKSLDEMEPLSFEQRAVARLGILKLAQEWTPNKRAIHTNSAYHLPDKLTDQTFDDAIVQYDETVLTAHIPTLRVAEIGLRQVVVLPCFETTVHGPAIEIDASLVELEMDMTGSSNVLPIGLVMRRPLYVPVDAISFIALAS